MIEGGYILLARQLIKSDIMEGSPLWIKLWVWMLNRANHKNGYKNLKKGQFFTTIEKMREAMSWKAGYRKEKPTVGEIRWAYETFTNNTMISTTKVTNGMLITILKYEHFQDPNNYEQHNEQHNENIDNNITYNKKGVCINKLSSSSSSSGSSSSTKLSSAKDFEIIKASKFQDLWEKYPKSVGKKAALRHFNAGVKTDQDLEDINKALNNYIQYIRDTGKETQYIQNGSTWFNNWRDWMFYRKEKPVFKETGVIPSKSVGLTRKNQCLTEEAWKYDEKCRVCFSLYSDDLGVTDREKCRESQKVKGVL